MRRKPTPSWLVMASKGFWGVGFRGLQVLGIRGLEGFRFRGLGLRGLGVQRDCGAWGFRGFEFWGSGVLALKF